MKTAYDFWVEKFGDTHLTKEEKLQVELMQEYGDYIMANYNPYGEIELPPIFVEDELLLKQISTKNYAEAKEQYDEEIKDSLDKLREAKCILMQIEGSTLKYYNSPRWINVPIAMIEKEEEELKSVFEEELKNQLYDYYQ